MEKDLTQEIYEHFKTLEQQCSKELEQLYQQVNGLVEQASPIEAAKHK